MKLSFQADRDPQQNSMMFEATRRVMVRGAVKDGLIKDDDLAMVPEVMPTLFRLAGTLRDDLYEYHRRMAKSLQLPIVQNCFCYCFAKGAEAAYLWNQSPNGWIEYSYLPEDALAGRAGAEVSDEFSLLITAGMQSAANVFCYFQNELLLEPKYRLSEGGRWLADFVACGLYWSAAIGLDFGMGHLVFRNRNLHLVVVQ